jgi:HSP20 family protein
MKTMTLVPWRKLDENTGLVQFEQAMNEVFDGFWPALETPASRPANGLRGWMPRLDVAETEKEIMVTAELPGLDEKNVNVNVSGDQLVISGEKLSDKDDRKKTWHRIERSYGSFQRVLPLYAEIDRNAIKASFKKGVLSVILPKTVKAQESVRKIPIEVG